MDDPTSGPEAGPVLFMHERRSRDGRRVLVVVRRTPPALSESIDLPLSFRVTVIDPEAPVGEAGARNTTCYDVLRPHLRVRFFAGQPDARDGSRFTIGYESGYATSEHRRGVVEGRVGEGRLPPVELENLGLDGSLDGDASRQPAIP